MKRTSTPSQSQLSEQVKDTDPSNKENISSFLDKISNAQMHGDEWIETTPEIIAHYNRKGLNGAKFFIFQGIKVCEHGQSEAIERENNEQMNRKLFGAKEGIVEGRTGE